MTDASPRTNDFVLELCHLKFDAAQAAHLSAWRNEFAKAPDAWDLRLAKRLLRELTRHDLGMIGREPLAACEKDAGWDRAHGQRMEVKRPSALRDRALILMLLDPGSGPVLKEAAHRDDRA